MSKCEKQGQNFPGEYCLDPDDREGLEKWLKNKSWVSVDDKVTGLEKAGQGNMNLVLRVNTRKAGSFILKQGRPWVEKYPSIAAPWGRTAFEYQFLNRLSKQKAFLSTYSFDEGSQIFSMEDLGSVEDLSHRYELQQTFSALELSFLEDSLRELHAVDIDPGLKAFRNLEMRRLNHEHIFVLPFEKKAPIDLDQLMVGLDLASHFIRKDAELKKIAARLGDWYLNCPPESLVHGDFYPGSFVKLDDNRLKIIDPEFGFAGKAEFDWSVLSAHLLFLGEKPETVISWLERNSKMNGLYLNWAQALAGVEVIRRLIGVAQLPLPYGLDRRVELLNIGAEWMRQIR